MGSEDLYYTFFFFLHFYFHNSHNSKQEIAHTTLENYCVEKPEMDLKCLNADAIQDTLVPLRYKTYIVAGTEERT